MPLCSRELRRSCASRFPPGARTRDLEHPAAVQAEEWRYDHWAPRSHVGGAWRRPRRSHRPARGRSTRAARAAAAFRHLWARARWRHRPDREPSGRRRQAAASASPCFVPPGNYTTSKLTLKSGTQIQCVPGASVLRYSGGGAIIAIEKAADIRLTGLTLAGEAKPIDG